MLDSLLKDDFNNFAPFMADLCRMLESMWLLSHVPTTWASVMVCCCGFSCLDMLFLLVIHGTFKTDSLQYLVKERPVSADSRTVEQPYVRLTSIWLLHCPNVNTHCRCWDINGHHC